MVIVTYIWEETHFYQNQLGVFYMHISTQITAFTISFARPVVDYWFEEKISQTANSSDMQDRTYIAGATA